MHAIIYSSSNLPILMYLMTIVIPVSAHALWSYTNIAVAESAICPVPDPLILRCINTAVHIKDPRLRNSTKLQGLKLLTSLRIQWAPPCNLCVRRLCAHSYPSISFRNGACVFRSNEPPSPRNYLILLASRTPCYSVEAAQNAAREPRNICTYAKAATLHYHLQKRRAHKRTCSAHRTCAGESNQYNNTKRLY